MGTASHTHRHTAHQLSHPAQPSQARLSVPCSRCDGVHEFDRPVQKAVHDGAVTHLTHTHKHSVCVVLDASHSTAQHTLYVGVDDGLGNDGSEGLFDARAEEEAAVGPEVAGDVDGHAAEQTAVSYVHVALRVTRR